MINYQKIVEKTVVEETVVEGPLVELKLVERSLREKTVVGWSVAEDTFNRKLELTSL